MIEIESNNTEILNQTGKANCVGELLHQPLDGIKDIIGRGIAVGGSVIAIAGGSTAIAQEQAPQQPNAVATQAPQEPIVYPENAPMPIAGCTPAGSAEKSKVRVLPRARILKTNDYYEYNRMIWINRANKDMNVTLRLKIDHLKYNKAVKLSLKNCNEMPRGVAFNGIRVRDDGDPSTPARKLGAQVLTVAHGTKTEYAKVKRNGKVKKIKRTVPNIIFQRKFVSSGS